jgi:hypothetical protein
MSDRQWEKLVRNISNSDPVKRHEWMLKQTPLLASLDERDERDAEDEPNPVSVIRTPQTAN